MRVLLSYDGFQKYNLWDQPINTFCQKVECITAEVEKIKMELKGSFPEVFSAGLGKCTKIMAKFELKENTRLIFRKKRNVPFTVTEEINKELHRLVNMGIKKRKKKILTALLRSKRLGGRGVVEALPISP